MTAPKFPRTLTVFGQVVELRRSRRYVVPYNGRVGSLGDIEIYCQLRKNGKLEYGIDLKSHRLGYGFFKTVAAAERDFLAKANKRYKYNNQHNTAIADAIALVVSLKPMV